MRVVLGLGVLVSLPWGGTLAAPALKPKANPLVGVWARLSVAEGDAVRLDKRQVRWEFTADGRQVVSRYDSETEGRYVADPGVAPMTIQITHGGGGLHGVYKVDGDRLTIALAERADPRPTGFATPPPPGVIVAVFHRVKDALTAADPVGPPDHGGGK